MSSTKKMIVLKTSDNESFEVEESVALESQTIKQMIEAECADGIIPLPNVTSNILAKIIEFCKRHVDASNKSSQVTADNKSSNDLKAFDAEFVKVDQKTLVDLILVISGKPYAGAEVDVWNCGVILYALLRGTLPFDDRSFPNLCKKIKAANYLDIKSLLDLTCQSVTDMMKGKSPEEIRKTFNIKNDYTPEEEEEVRRENAWAFG